jgi:alpha-L-fucosidase 2
MNKNLIFSGMLVFCVVAMHGDSAAANYAFDQSNGVLAVDYANYISKHNLVFNSPITASNSGLTIGNGRVGAMVWNTNGITMQVTGVDASPQTIFSEGLLNLSTRPRMDSAYTTFQQTLSLYDGLITTRYDANRMVTIMGSPNSEVLGIHVDDSRTGLNSITFQLNMWDPATQMTSNGTWNSMMSDLPDTNTWRTVTSFANATVAGINRGQTDVNNFGYTLAATVDGATFTTQQVDARTVRFTITPTSSYTIWIACASRLNAPGNNSVTQATNLLTAIKTAGYTSTLTAYKNWWHAFWAKSFVQYSNTAKDADYSENVYYLANYLIASGAYGNYPFHFVSGVYRNNADIGITWSGAYWYYDQRNFYASLLASNHVDALGGYYRLYSRNYAKMKSFTQTRFSIDGIWVPETIRWDGDAIWTTTSTYTDRIMSTGAEVASSMFASFAYTNDSAFLKNTAYPMMREAAKFLSAKLSYDATSKRYYMANSNSHETYWGVKNAITDLAAVRSLFPQAIQAAKALNLDPALQTRWQNILDSLVPFKTEAYNGGSRYIPYDPPTVNSSNVENVVCEMIYPYNQTGIGKPDYQTILNNFKSRPFPYPDVWTADAIYAARLGLGDSVFNGMRLMLKKYQNFPNGLIVNNNNRFEQFGTPLMGINESLLQSYNDTIRVFPALPSDAAFVSKFTLLAKGGFLVSSEKEGGEIKYVGVKSLYGNAAAFVNPWGTQQVQVRKTSDNSVVLTTANAAFSFTTIPAGIYVVERTAKNLSTYTFAQLTGAPNYSVKTMTYSGTTVSLGFGAGNAPPVSVKPFVASTTSLVPSITVKVAGGRIFLPKTCAGKEYSLAIYNLSGKQIKVIVTAKEIVDLKKDFGIPAGAYIVRALPFSR